MIRWWYSCGKGLELMGGIIVIGGGGGTVGGG